MFLVDKRKLIMITISVQLVLCIVIGMQKRNFFCDETYSYGLANSEDYTFIDPETAKQYAETGWVDKKYFENYLQVSQDVPFSFKAAFKNQSNDVHPPFYYCLLHVFSLLNGGVLSKWTGLALNFVILILIDLCMFYLLNYLVNDIRVSILIILFWTFSGAGLSNILFIRMYMLLTCEMLAYVAIHVKLLEQQKMEIRDILNIILIVAFGGLTHYYFYLFVVCFSAPIGIYFMLSKRLKEMLMYGINICAGVVAALCIFPDTLIHIFYGYRGTETIGNLSHGREDWVVKAYFNMINDSIFAGKFQICLMLIIVLVAAEIILKYFVNMECAYNRQTGIVDIRFGKRNNVSCGKIQFVFRNKFILEILIVLSYGVFSIVVMKGSGLVHNRYLYPIYPIIAWMMVTIMSRILGNMIKSAYIRMVMMSGVCAMLCIGSIWKYKVDFMYGNYDVIYQQALQTEGTDCLLYYGDGWCDVYTLFPLRFLHDETYLMRSKDMDNVAEILSLRASANDLTVCTPTAYSDEDTKNILDRIIMQTGKQGYRLIYRVDYLQEWLLE